MLLFAVANALSTGPAAAETLDDGLYLVVEAGSEGAVLVPNDARSGGDLYVRSSPLISLARIRNAKVREHASGEISVLLELAGVEAADVEAATAEHLRELMAVVVGGVVVTVALIYEPIASTTLQISGGDTREEAEGFVSAVRRRAGLPE